MSSGTAIGTYNSLYNEYYTDYGEQATSFYVVDKFDPSSWNVGIFKFTGSNRIELVTLEDYPNRTRYGGGGSHELEGTDVFVYEVLSSGLLSMLVDRPIKVVTGTTYALTLADLGKTIYFTSSSAVVVTPPQVPKFYCRLVRGGTGTVTVDTTTGITIVGGPAISAQGKSATLHAADANNYSTQYMFE